MKRALDSAMGFPSRSTSASVMLWLLMPEEVRRSFMKTLPSRNHTDAPASVGQTAVSGPWWGGGSQRPRSTLLDIMYIIGLKLERVQTDARTHRTPPARVGGDLREHFRRLEDLDG